MKQRNVAKDEANIAEKKEGKAVPRTSTFIMLYGAGETGKTTIVRRLILSNEKDLRNERARLKNRIRYNVLDGAFKCCFFAEEIYGKTFEGGVNVAGTPAHAVKYIMDFNARIHDDRTKVLADTPITPEFRDALRILSKDATFMSLLDQYHKFGLFETYRSYFFWKGLDDNWGSEDWFPSEEDLLRSRIKTTGAIEYKFDFVGNRFHLIDVGGQRNERTKALIYFRTVNAIIFVMSLADYAEQLDEEHQTNRLEESLRLWVNTLRNPLLEGKWVILLMNKVDLFKRYFTGKDTTGDRITDPIPIRLTFKHSRKEIPPLYDPENEKMSIDRALQWFENLFLRRAPKYPVPENPNEKVARVRVYTASAFEEEDLRLRIEEISAFLAMKGALSHTPV